MFILVPAPLVKEMLVYVLSLYCTQIASPNATIEREYANIYVKLSQEGFRRYIGDNLKFMQEYIQQITIGDVNMNVAGFKLSLKDIKVMDLYIPAFELQFFDSNNAQLALDGLKINIQLNFQLSQTSYPYISDSGPGYIRLSGFTIRSYLFVHQNEECYGHIKLTVQDTYASLEDISIKLDGKLGFIYDAVMGLMSSMLHELFNKALNNELIQAILDMVNLELEKQSPDSVTSHGGRMDQRWISVDTRDKMLVVASPGVVCPFADYQLVCKTPVPDRRKKEPSYLYNSHIQYLINRDTFATNCDVVSQRHQNQFKLFDSSFSNTGMVVHAQNIAGNAELILNCPFEAYIQVINQKLNRTAVKATKCMQVNCVGDGCADAEAVKQLVSTVSEALNDAPVTYNNGNGVRDCKVIIVQSEWLDVACSIGWE